MKELSIEEKAKAYDEALERMKSWVKGEHPECFTEAQKAAEFIFPELVENEEERIRKSLCKAIWTYMPTKEGQEYIAWLEKQGEQKPADKIKPKFKVGDIIRLKDGDGLEWTVEEVLNNGYYTIVCADRDDFIQLNDKWELVEQKPTWSEEDENMLNHIISDIESLKEQVYCETLCNEEIDWLKSLKQRYTWKPSDEQIRALHNINLTGNISYAGQGQVLIELYNDLIELCK